MFRSLLLVLLLACPAWAQGLKLPAEIRAMPGSMFIVAPEVTEGWGPPKWDIGDGLQEQRIDLLLPPELVKQLRGKIFSAEQGRYAIKLWNARKDSPEGEVSDIVTCVIVIGNPPVKPTPDTPVNPHVPAPVLPLAGMRVLVLEETSPTFDTVAEKARWMAQVTVMRSPRITAYLNAKCLKGTDGSPQWRKYDPHPSFANLPREWQELRARTIPTTLSWVVIADSSGRVFFEGQLPATEAEALALFQKYGG